MYNNNKSINKYRNTKHPERGYCCPLEEEKKDDHMATWWAALHISALNIGLNADLGKVISKVSSDCAGGIRKGLAHRSVMGGFGCHNDFTVGRVLKDLCTTD